MDSNTISKHEFNKGKHYSTSVLDNTNLDTIAVNISKVPVRRVLLESWHVVSTIWFPTSQEFFHVYSLIQSVCLLSVHQCFRFIHHDLTLTALEAGIVILIKWLPRGTTVSSQGYRWLWPKNCFQYRNAFCITDIWQTFIHTCIWCNSLNC